MDLELLTTYPVKVYIPLRGECCFLEHYSHNEGSRVLTGRTPDTLFKTFESLLSRPPRNGIFHPEKLMGYWQGSFCQPPEWYRRWYAESSYDNEVNEVCRYILNAASDYFKSLGKYPLGFKSCTGYIPEFGRDSSEEHYDCARCKGSKTVHEATNPKKVKPSKATLADSFSELHSIYRVRYLQQRADEEEKRVRRTGGKIVARNKLRVSDAPNPIGNYRVFVIGADLGHHHHGTGISVLSKGKVNGAPPSGTFGTQPVAFFQGEDYKIPVRFEKALKDLEDRIEARRVEDREAYDKKQLEYTKEQTKSLAKLFDERF